MPLLLSVSLENLEALKHSLTNLVGSFLFIVKFLLVHTVFGSKEGSQFGPAFLEVGTVLASQLLKTALHVLAHNHSVGLVLPLGSQSQVLVTVDFGKILLQFLNKVTESRPVLTNSYSRRAWM